jgi:hypothetical protein
VLGIIAKALGDAQKLHVRFNEGRNYLGIPSIPLTLASPVVSCQNICFEFNGRLDILDIKVLRLSAASFVSSG